MNKRECVDFIKIEIEKCEKEFMDDWKATGSPKQQIKINAYINCKKICAKNGYVDKTFEDLWNKAVFELRYVKR
jgi:hypothetical protein